jgi:ubiquinone/menaquinone biosynthesis C-methylase UbiE/dienelactone hydrolase
MFEQRKDIRVPLESLVQVESRNHCFQGKMVDISRSGMKIVADIPESLQTIKSITFALPKSDEPLRVPCKLVRKEIKQPDEQGQVFGLEFFYQNEAQMLLVESFIKEKKLKQLKDQVKNAEMRQIPRTDCVIKNISSDRKGISVTSIDNISVDGILISYRGEGINPQDKISLTFKLPDDSRDLTVSGRISYVKENPFKGTSYAGIVLDKVNEIDRIRIRNFISSYTVAVAMKALYEKFYDTKIDEKYVIHDRPKIDSLFSMLYKERIQMNVLLEDSHKMMEASVIGVDSNKRTFGVDKHVRLSNADIKKDHTAYFLFNVRSGTYYFKTNLVEVLESQINFLLPDTVFQSEKRSYQRKIIRENIVFSNITEDQSKGAFQGTLTNISRRGFLCEFPPEKGHKDFFQPGRIVNYRAKKELGLGTYGEVRHVSETKAPHGREILQLGIESGIKHKPFRFTRYSQAEWDKHNLYQGNLPLSAGEKINSTLVKYPNRKGQEITALVNATHKKTTAPVVILPPAFGKKKETLSPLAATLITNFRCLNKEIVIVRYDGINRPGESYNEEMLPKRGYEMLYYRISQGQDDLQATIDYVHSNPHFRPSHVIVAAFSMSALDIRKLVSKSKNHKVDCIVNVMGVTCGQSAFKNMTGGLDIIGYHKLGIENGVYGILGHMLDLDNIAEDLIDQKYAYMTDARLDMSQISIPILWIYGKYDRWIDEKEVKELMGMESAGSREVIEIPTGHNIRSSEDAIKTFELITAWIYKKLYDETITPIEPDKANLVNLITYERERISSSEEFNSEEYWKQYLIGKDLNSFGYDFYKNIQEFRDFLTFQSQLIDLKDKERIVDMGCGTGLQVENMLNRAAKQKRDIRDAQLIMIDVVEEALDKTKAKVERIQKNNRALQLKSINYMVKDLEPNRLIPVFRFVSNTSLDFNFLRNRIEGFSNTAVDRLLENSSKRLYEIMRGKAVTRNDELYLMSEFKAEYRQVITDFNRAARFLKRMLHENDFIDPELTKKRSIDSLKYDRLCTSDLKFDKLNFGHYGLRLKLDFSENYFDKIIASLFISYLFNPDEIFHEFYRMLKPNGLLLVSSMKPDSDISLIFTNYVDKVQHFDFSGTDIKSQEISLLGAREMLNEAATLFELEEDGYFKFFSEKELVDMFETAGFHHVRVFSSLGNPPQAVIITGRKNPE